METASDVASFPCHVVTLSLSPCHEVFSGRGFILFLLGFLGGGITSTEPPWAFWPRHSPTGLCCRVSPSYRDRCRRPGRRASCALAGGCRDGSSKGPLQCHSSQTGHVFACSQFQEPADGRLHKIGRVRAAVC